MCAAVFCKEEEHTGLTAIQLLLLAVLKPCMIVQLGTKLLGGNLVEVLVQGAIGWKVWGLWTQVVVWVVWFPAWLVGTTVVSTGMWNEEN